MNRMERIRERQRKREEIEVMMEDYRQSLLAYAEFMDDFRKRTGRMHPFLPVAHETEAA